MTTSINKNYHQDELEREAPTSIESSSSLNPQPNINDKTYHIKTLEEINEKELDWIIEDFILKEQITVIGGDGGVGKGLIVSDILGALSSGNKAFFEDNEKFLKQHRKPQKVMFLSSEDSMDTVVKKRIRLNNIAKMSNIYVIGAEDPFISKVKIGSKELENLICEVKPVLTVLDPIQAFLPVNTNMSAKIEMRQHMASLKKLAEKYETSFILLAHTNKRETSGRKRIGDSAEIWDASRSVFIVGRVDTQTYYFSHEKCNYGKLQDTVLYEINNGKIIYKGLTYKKDEDFVQSSYKDEKSIPRNEIKDLIIDVLKSSENNKISNKELKETIINNGYSERTYERAKKELKEESKIQTKSTGKGKERIGYVILIE